jgi:ankyrin repeat protein
MDEIARTRRSLSFMSKEEIEDRLKKEELHITVMMNDLQRVKELINSGYDVNMFDEIGYTPLHYACIKGNIAIAEYLIEHGADVNAHHEGHIGNTPLGEVAGSCSLKMAELLLEHGADPSIRGWMQLNALDRAEDRKDKEGEIIYSLCKKTL